MGLFLDSIVRKPHFWPLPGKSSRLGNIEPDDHSLDEGTNRAVASVQTGYWPMSHQSNGQRSYALLSDNGRLNKTKLNDFRKIQCR